MKAGISKREPVANSIRMDLLIDTYRFFFLSLKWRGYTLSYNLKGSNKRITTIADRTSIILSLLTTQPRILLRRFLGWIYLIVMPSQQGRPRVGNQSRYRLSESATTWSPNPRAPTFKERGWRDAKSSKEQNSRYVLCSLLTTKSEMDVTAIS